MLCHHQMFNIKWFVHSKSQNSCFHPPDFMHILEYCIKKKKLKQRPKYFQASQNSSTGRIKRIIVTEAQTDYIWSESWNYGAKRLVYSKTANISCTFSSLVALTPPNIHCLTSKASATRAEYVAVLIWFASKTIWDIWRRSLEIFRRLTLKLQNNKYSDQLLWKH